MDLILAFRDRLTAIHEKGFRFTDTIGDHHGILSVELELVEKSLRFTHEENVEAGSVGQVGGDVKDRAIGIGNRQCNCNPCLSIGSGIPGALEFCEFLRFYVGKCRHKLEDWPQEWSF